MKNIILFAVFSCFLFLAAVLQAQTVAWWRMEGSPGTSAAVLADSGADSLDAVASSADAAVFTNSFTAVLTNASSNSSGVYLSNADNMGSKRFSVADDRLKMSGDFTVEAFFRWGGTYTLAAGATAGIFGKVRATPVSCTYGVGLYGNSVVARFYTGTDETISSTGIDPQDGRWHHVAITYEKAARKAALWVDYRKCGEKTLAADLVYADGTSFLIGSVGSRSFSGQIDEVRVSGSVLTPGTFLEARIPVGKFLDAAEPAGTVYRYRFGDVEVGFSEQELATTNDCAWRLSQLKDRVDSFRVNLADFSSGSLSSVSAEDPVSAEDVPSARCYFAECRTNAFANTSASSFPGSDGYTLSLESVDRLSAGDFTVECFVKVREQSSSMMLVGQLSGIQPNPYLPLWQIGTDDYGNLVFSYACTNGQSTVARSNIAFGKKPVSGQWHHVAAVYTDSGRSVRLYFDHVPVNEAVLEHHLAGVGVSTTMRIGYRNGGWNGLLDEIRVVEAALDPTEFMSTVAMPPLGSGSVVAHFGFNGSWDDSIGVYTTVCPAVSDVLSSIAGSTAPDFSADVHRPFVFDDASVRACDAFSANTASVSVSTGIVRIAESPAYAFKQKEFTVEWFVKFPAGETMCRWANIVDLVREDGVSVWIVRVDENNRLYVCFNADSTFHPGADAKSLNDGKWHHVALTCREHGEPVATDVRLYVDGEPYLDGEAGDVLTYNDDRTSLFLRLGTPNGMLLQRFLLDELRYTVGIKQPGDFIRQGRGASGLTVIVR